MTESPRAMDKEPAASLSLTPVPGHASNTAVATRLRVWLIHWVGRVDILAAVILLGLSCYATALNIGGWYVLHYIDISWPVDPASYSAALLNAWSPQNLGAFEFVNAFNLPFATWLTLLQSASIPIPLQEFLTLAGLQALGSYFVFVILRRFVVDPSGFGARFVCIAGAVAYMLNYYALVIGWWDNIPGFFVLMGFGPVFIYCALVIQSDLLASKRVSLPAIGALAASSFFAFSTNVPFNIALFALAVLVPPVAWGAAHAKDPIWVRRIASYGLTLGVVILTSLWWIVPDALEAQYLPTYIGGAQATSYNLALFVSASAPVNFLSVLTGFYQIEYPAYAHTTAANFSYLALGGSTAVLIGATAIVGLLLAHRGESRWRQAWLVAAILILGLVVTGVNSPLSSTLEQLLESNSVMLQVLRNPFLSVGFAVVTLLILAGTNGVAIVLAELNSRGLDEPRRWLTGRHSDDAPTGRARTRHNGRLPLVSAVLVASILFVPFLASGGPILLGNALPGAPFEARSAIPTYEYDVANYLEPRLNGTYALLYPGGFLEQNWTDGYDGYDVLPSLLPNAFLAYDDGSGFVATPNAMLDEAYQSIGAGTTNSIDFSSLLTRLGVSFIVIEGEVGGYYPFNFGPPPDYPKVLGSLNTTSGLDSPLSIGPDYIYQTASAHSVVGVASQSVDESSLIDGTMVPEINITALFENTTSVATADAPAPMIWPSAFASSPTYIVNASERAVLTDDPLAQPLTSLNQPIVFNGVPISINTSVYSTLSVTFTTNPETAITISAVDVSDLAALNWTSLQAHLIVLGGASGSLGYGSASLFSAYGADHYWTDGRSETLVDNLTQSLAGAASDSIFYLLISVFPVSSGKGLNGLPMTNWPGVQEFSIQSIELGNPYYATPLSPPTPISATVPGGQAIRNFTAAFSLSAANNSGAAPTHNFLPQANATGLSVTLDGPLKTEINDTPLAPPFGPSYPPTVYNSEPIPISVQSGSYVSLAIDTNGLTAVTATLIAATNLSSINASTLAESSHQFGGTGNSLGLGDLELLPEFGADHFDTFGQTVLMTQQATGSFGSNFTAYFLLVSMFPVAANGSGIPGLPVEQWPGNQTLSITGLYLSDFLLRGEPASVPSGFFGPVAVSNATTSLSFSASTAVSNAVLPVLNPTATATLLSWTATDFRVLVSVADPAAGAILLVLRQNYASGWFASGAGLGSVDHIEVDSSLNGFLVTFRPGANLTVVSISFSGQGVYRETLVIGFGIAVGTIVGLPFVIALCRRLRPRQSAK